MLSSRWRGILLATVVAAGCFAQSATASALPCGTVVTTSITLTSDIGPCDFVDGLVVGASDITIDLNGHTIFGGGAFAEVGIDATGHNRVTIRNGTVTNLAGG